MTPPPIGAYASPTLQAAVAPAAPLKIPGVIIAASILWIIYGSLSVLGGLASLRAGAFSYFNLSVGVAFVTAGIQTLTGKVSSVLATGITCLVLGGLGVLVMLALMGGALGHVRVVGFLVVVILINTSILVTAGSLALVGNKRYKAWRASRG